MKLARKVRKDSTSCLTSSMSSLAPPTTPILNELVPFRSVPNVPFRAAAAALRHVDNHDQIRGTDLSTRRQRDSDGGKNEAADCDAGHV